MLLLVVIKIIFGRNFNLFVRLNCCIKWIFKSDWSKIIGFIKVIKVRVDVIVMVFIYCKCFLFVMKYKYWFFKKEKYLILIYLSCYN